MIDKELLQTTVSEVLDGTDCYIVEITVGSDNTINVELDSDTGVDIDTCAAVTRRVEEVFDREAEDYALEVGSAGITAPLKIRRQYEHNIGNDMEVLTRDGRKLHGVLTEVSAGAPDDRSVEFTLEVPVKVKEPGAKKPVVRPEAVSLSSTECKYVRYDLKF